MNLKLPIGIGDFREAVTEGYHLVDKSTFIKDMVDIPKVTLITRPRRFGKTLNMSMLYYFLEGYTEEGTKHLFGDFEISKDQAFCAQHQRQYPVIFISFKDIKKKDFEEAKAKFRTLISILYQKYEPFLFDTLTKAQKRIYTQIIDETSNDAHLEGSLKRLCQYLMEKTGKKPFLLIDEYDTPITSAYVQSEQGESADYEKMMLFIRGLFGEALKENEYLNKGILTGITRIAKESIFSDVNNFESYGILNEFCGEYFGFTEIEVTELLKLDGHPEKKSDIKDWYNGYQIGSHTIYNPWSIINCIKQDYELSSYWANTSSNELIKQLITHSKAEIKEVFIDLLQGNPCEQRVDEQIVFPELAQREQALWSLLLSSGYLKVDAKENREGRIWCQLAIPNKEVALIYDEIIDHWFSASLSFKKYTAFITNLIEGNIQQFNAILNEYLLQSGSVFDFDKRGAEQVFHTFVLGLVMGLKDHYIIESNRESGFGRFDVMIIPKDTSKTGHVLEFKVAANEAQLKDKANEALAQIKDKAYITALEQRGIKHYQLLGLAFCGKQALVLNEFV